MKQKKRKKLFFLVSILGVLFYRTTILYGSPTISLATPSGPVRVDGDNMVWMSYQENNWEIYFLDQSTGKETQITNQPDTQGYPDIWDHYIVWQDDRNHKDSFPNQFDIYLYDLQTREEKKISTIEGNHQQPLIQDNKIVWVNHENGNKDVMLYNMETKEIKQVSSKDAEAFGVQFDGKYIAWMDCRGLGGDFNIYLYDIVGEQERQITYGRGDELDMFLAEGNLLWTEVHNNVRQIYMYETDTQYVTRMTVGKEDHTPIAFEEDRLLIQKENGLVMEDIDSRTQESLVAPYDAVPDQANIVGNQVIWFYGGNMVKESIATAKSRTSEEVIELPTSENPSEDTQKDTSEEDDHDSKDKSKKEETQKQENEFNQDKFCIKANEDTVVWSQDKNMSLFIPKGTFSQEVYGTLSQEQGKVYETYEGIGPVYSWNIEAETNPQKAIEVRIIYDAEKTMVQPKKIWIYDVEDMPKPLFGIREENKIIASVHTKGKANLMTYEKNFTDMENHWAYKYVDIIASHHIIDGYTDGSYKPNQNISRAEFVKLVVSSLVPDIEKTTDTNNIYFEDVNEANWAAPYIKVAASKGWIKGDGKNFFPNELITREQMVMILIRAYNDLNEGYIEVLGEVLPYEDMDEVSPWAQEAIKKALSYGWIQGYGGQINPKANATRGEVATLIYRYLESLKRL